MKELIVNALKAAGIETDGLTDEQLFAAYNGLQASQADGSGDDDGDANDTVTAVGAAVAEAIAPLAQRLDGVEAALNAADSAELDQLAEIVGNSDKYPGIDADDAKKLGVEKLRTMATNCAGSHGLPLALVPNADGGDGPTTFDMPNSAA